ncbi:uncharacterized protein TNCV_3659321 [Trichonephila clavipes]|nr:uncharacterized protein TNCV_3659321 [Trichonephila clavipes]
MGSNLVPLKTRSVGERCKLNLSRTQTSSHWCGVEIRRAGCQFKYRPRHLTMVQNYRVRRQKVLGQLNSTTLIFTHSRTRRLRVASLNPVATKDLPCKGS